MIYLPNRQKSPDVYEQLPGFDAKKEGYGFWETVWVELRRSEEGSSRSYMHRFWWCYIN